MINSDSVIRRNPQVVARELSEEDGAVLLHLESGQYHGVNPVGLVIWELLEQERTLSSLVEAVRARVSGPSEDLESDVKLFLVSVQERDLVIVD